MALETGEAQHLKTVLVPKVVGLDHDGLLALTRPVVPCQRAEDRCLAGSGFAEVERAAIPDGYRKVFDLELPEGDAHRGFLGVSSVIVPPTVVTDSEAIWTAFLREAPALIAPIATSAPVPMAAGVSMA